MKSLVINNHALTDEDIKDTVTRVKCFVENDKGQIILGQTDLGCLQFPGGHVEEGEDLALAAIREIKEETGIEIDKEKVIAFFELKNYVKNYRDYGYNRIARMVYFYVKTNKKINMKKSNLTEEEKALGLKTSFVSLEQLEQRLIKTKSESSVEIYRIIADEMLCALQEFQYFKTQKNIN